MRRAGLAAAMLLIACATARAQAGSGTGAGELIVRNTFLLDEKVKLLLSEGQTISYVVLGVKKPDVDRKLLVTFVLEGKVTVKDSRGKAAIANAGDAIWSGDLTNRPMRGDGDKKSGRALTLLLPNPTENKIASFVRTSGKAPTYEILGGKGSVTILIDQDSGGDGTAYVGRIRIQKGAQVPEHVHANESEIIYVISGKGELTIDGETVAVEPGKAFHIPPNTKHSFTATEDVDAVQFYTPAGPEQRFKGTAKK